MSSSSATGRVQELVARLKPDVRCSPPERTSRGSEKGGCPTSLCGSVGTMSRFGFFPRDAAEGSVAPPRGYAAATVRVGELVETVFCDLSIWTIDDYVNHWREGASKCIAEARPFLFCTDLTKRNATVFAAFPQGDGYACEQWIIRRRDFTVSGMNLTLNRSTDMVRGGGDTSSWWTDRVPIAAFANSD